MGLDMYANTTSEAINSSVDFQVDESNMLHYWRKHPDLHGWMEKLYYAKGGAADSFNCVTVSLTMDDLNRLEQDVRDAQLPATRGFFFGASHGSELQDDLDFIKKARTAIQSGLTVFYDSWW